MASVYSVSQVNAYIKNMFAQDFALNRISVKGEVSNCKYHPSGHIYFTLKDRLGAIQAIMFAGKRRNLTFQLKEGQQVVVKGSIEVYERDGRYQLYASEITLDGTGDLFKRFEKLRNELEEMGMFAPEYKQPIPAYASRVGIVTALTGAAIRDIINIARRRNPYVQLVLCPALVQGDGAAASIVRGIRRLDAMGLDVLIVGRGGGAIEDLWAFNEEEVARAIFACRTPVISAVGHETDVTIADYAADLRAPTPSAAAELAVYDYRQTQMRLTEYALSMHRLLSRQVTVNRSRLFSPGRRLNERRQRLADMEGELERLMKGRTTEARHRLALLSGRLHGLSPLERIRRGFGFLTDGDGKKITSVSDVNAGDTVRIQVSDGRITAKAQEITREDAPGTQQAGIF